MLYGKNQSGNNSSTHSHDDEIKKRREDAQRETEHIKSIQRQQSRINTQQEINRQKHQLEILVREIQGKEQKLTVLKRKKEQVEKEVFDISREIKKKEGGAGYLKDQVLVHERRVSSTRSEAEKIKAKLDFLHRETADAETKKEQINILISGAQQKIARLQTELDRAQLEVDRLRKNALGADKTIDSKKRESDRLTQTYQSLNVVTEDVSNHKSEVLKSTRDLNQEIMGGEGEIVIKKRIIEDCDIETRLVSVEITRLKQEKISKEMEISNLEAKMSAPER